MDYSQDPETLILGSLHIDGEPDPTMTSHRKTALFRELLRDGERKTFDMFHFTFREHTSVYAAIEVASRFTGASDITIIGSTPENEGFLRSDGTGLFHEDSVDMEEHSNRMRDALEEVTMSMMAAGVNTGQCFEQGAMTGGAAVYTRGSVLDYFGLYTQMNRRTHPAVVNFARDAWAELCTRYPSLTQAIKETITP